MSVYTQSFHSENLPNLWKMYLQISSHRNGILQLLQCASTRAAVEQALKARSKYMFEEEATAAGMCVSAVRTFEQWDDHPQGQALKGKLPIELIKIADAPPRAKTKSALPLEGIRMLELTRVVAGPVGGRVVASLGADVLWVTSPQLPSLPDLDLDTSRGKRTTQLDLTVPEDAERLRKLLSGADVFLQSYRAGSLSHRGFSPEELARLRPGIIVANLRGYGWEGPWAGKRAVRIRPLSLMVALASATECLAVKFLSSIRWFRLPLVLTLRREKPGQGMRGKRKHQTKISRHFRYSA